MTPRSMDYLPTLDQLNTSVPDDLNVHSVAQDWLSSFTKAVNAQNIPSIMDTIHPDGWWRDLVALTWDLRTFHGAGRIRTFLSDRLVESKFIVIPDLVSAQLLKPFPDIVEIVAQFNFTVEAGTGIGTAFLVPTASGEWKAFILCTDLDSIKGTQEAFGRAREQAFEEKDPEVLVVGAGQAGLDLAARLKNLGVSTLVVDKNENVGDQWRRRYDSLRLHDFVWLNHLPYMKFPDSFPVHIPCKKLADWLALYATAMDLNIWTSTAVSKAMQDEKTGKWAVTVTKSDGSERILNVDHVVFATGWVGEPHKPEFPSREKFKGQVLHSSEYSNPRNYIGKKVLVVGACTSGHDISADCAHYGIDVTMFQRSSTFMLRVEDFKLALSPLYREGGPPTEVADRMLSAIPNAYTKLLGPREVGYINHVDGERRRKLESLGYRMNEGVDGATGSFWVLVSRAGGQYVDQGACDLILEGKIKMKSGTQIECYTPTGVRFQDGTEVAADVVVLATGYGDIRDPIRSIVGDEIGKKLTKIWGVNEEGELNSMYKEMGVSGLWYISGSLGFCRIYSKHLALQLKAKQMGLFTTRYSAAPVY
ncbi:hypothetical protein EIP91_009323 [Steccherinum ochraceum]|uniref:FAD/NAD(P)-binding domain-containing protein n=1 Tax=Steccherinum ochraceum TaxID=92696 RepID=A0A4R0RP71_9APHY|nr:hypothetical protein EIP91_009323 [Steccherinum ochraceum]